MGPPSAIMGRMRVSLVVAKLVMNTVRGHPEDGSAFQGERAADGQEILQPLGRAVAAMREQPMVAHADAHVDAEYPEPDEAEESLPGKHEESGHGEHMKGHHEAGSHPVGLVGLGFAAQNRHLIELFRGACRSRLFCDGFGLGDKRYGSGRFYEFGRHDLGRALSLCPVKLNLTGRRFSVRKSFVMTIGHTYDSAICRGICAFWGLMVANFLRLSSTALALMAACPALQSQLPSRTINQLTSKELVEPAPGSPQMLNSLPMTAAAVECDPVAGRDGRQAVVRRCWRIPRRGGTRTMNDRTYS